MEEIAYQLLPRQDDSGEAGPERTIVITLKKPRDSSVDERQIGDQIRETIKKMPEVLDVLFVKQWDRGFDVLVNTSKHGRDTIKLVCR